MAGLVALTVASATLLDYAFKVEYLDRRGPYLPRVVRELGASLILGHDESPANRS